MYSDAGSKMGLIIRIGDSAINYKNYVRFVHSTFVQGNTKVESELFYVSRIQSRATFCPLQLRGQC